MLQAHELSKYLDRTQPVKSLAWSDVQQIRQLSTAIERRLSFTGVCHSSQKLTVPLFGLFLGSSILIRLGSKLASPTIKASPVSRVGRISLNPPRLSGNSLFMTA